MELEENLNEPLRYGPWQVLGKLGRGGMGEVLLVERSTPRQRAALKLLPSVRSEEERRSHQREQRLLARLEHPNIARLLDTGETDDGRTYLVLELVEGERIDDYCRQRELPLEARLKLFIAVCRAVSAAHQQLIVHCDLKPSNVLVRSEDGAVKLLDFGLARQVADSMSTSTLVSSFSTWAYASPEQLAGRPLSTATDVYSLGVLLHEIVTGKRLYSAVEPGFLNHVEARQTPPRASSSLGEGSPDRLRRALKQNLDYVIAKALRSEPEARYGSVDEMVEDLEAFCAGLPVKARQNDRVYTLRCWLRRHLLPVAAAFALVTTALAAAVILGLQARKLAAERDLAQRQETIAQETSEFFLGLLRNPPESGLWTIRSLASSAVLELDKELLDSWPVRARILDMLGDHYRFVGNLGQAELLLEEALAIWEAHHGADSRDTIYALEGLAVLRLEAGATESGCELAQEVAQRVERSKDASAITLALSSLGFCALKEERFEDSAALWEQALALTLRQSGASSDDYEAQLQNLLKAQTQIGRDSDVERTLQRLIESRKLRRPSRLDPLVLEWRYRLATAKVARQALDEAELELRSIQEDLRGQASPFHSFRSLQAGEVDLQLAEIRRRRGDSAEALRLARSAVASLTRDLPPDNPRHRLARRIEALALFDAGFVAEARERLWAEWETGSVKDEREAAELREAFQVVFGTSASAER